MPRERKGGRAPISLDGWGHYRGPGIYFLARCDSRTGEFFGEPRRVEVLDRKILNAVERVVFREEGTKGLKQFLIQAGGSIETRLELIEPARG